MSTSDIMYDKSAMLNGDEVFITVFLKNMSYHVLGKLRDAVKEEIFINNLILDICV